LWAELHERDEWVIYPWETKDSLPIQDYLANDAKKERDALEEYYKSDEWLEFAEMQDAAISDLDKREGIHLVAGMSNDKEGSFMKFQNKIKNKKL